MNTDEVLKALEEEIERAEHQMSIASTTHMRKFVGDPTTDTERKRWKKYVRHLYDMAAEVSLIGIKEKE